MTLSTLIVRRVLQAPLILLVIYTLTLFLAWQIPGSPLDNPEGRRPPPEVQRAMEAQYKLDSFWGFYTSYLDNATGVKWVRETLTGEAAERAKEAEAAGRPAPIRPSSGCSPRCFRRSSAWTWSWSTATAAASPSAAAPAAAW